MVVKYSVITVKGKFLLQPLVTKFLDETVVLESFNIIEDRISSSSNSDIVGFLACSPSSLNLLDLTWNVSIRYILQT